MAELVDDVVENGAPTRGAAMVAFIQRRRAVILALVVIAVVTLQIAFVFPDNTSVDAGQTIVEVPVSRVVTTVETPTTTVPSAPDTVPAAVPVEQPPPVAEVQAELVDPPEMGEPIRVYTPSRRKAPPPAPAAAEPTQESLPPVELPVVTDEPGDVAEPARSAPAEPAEDEQKQAEDERKRAEDERKRAEKQAEKDRKQAEDDDDDDDDDDEDDDD